MRGPVSMSGPVPSGPVVSGPVPSGPVVSGPVPKFIIFLLSELCLFGRL